MQNIVAGGGKLLAVAYWGGTLRDWLRTPRTVEQIRSRLKDMQKGNHADVSALADLLRAS